MRSDSSVAEIFVFKTPAQGYVQFVKLFYMIYAGWYNFNSTISSIMGKQWYDNNFIFWVIIIKCYLRVKPTILFRTQLRLTID